MREKGTSVYRCEVCEVVFIRPIRPGPKPKYCSPKCIRYAGRQRIEDGTDNRTKYRNRCRHCLICFETTISGQKFCNPICFSLASRSLKNKVVTCVICNKGFTPRAKHQKCCSAECAKIKEGNTKRRRGRLGGVSVVPICRCEMCFKLFRPIATDRMTYCSRRCSALDNFGKEYIQKDHWPEQSCNVYFILCRHCGELFTSRNGLQYCSVKCQRALAYCNSRERRGIQLNQKECAVCGEVFQTYNSNRIVCSDMCQGQLRLDAKRRRRARLREVKIETFAAVEIFRRDNWRCKICGRKLSKNRKVPHPLAPTLDHIVPLSIGGTHERKNVQLSCFRCNSKKSNGTISGGEQLLLFG